MAKAGVDHQAVVEGVEEGEVGVVVLAVKVQVEHAAIVRPVAARLFVTEPVHRSTRTPEQPDGHRDGGNQKESGAGQTSPKGNRSSSHAVPPSGRKHVTHDETSQAYGETQEYLDTHDAK